MCFKRFSNVFQMFWSNAWQMVFKCTNCARENCTPSTVRLGCLMRLKSRVATATMRCARHALSGTVAKMVNRTNSRKMGSFGQHFKAIFTWFAQSHVDRTIKHLSRNSLLPNLWRLSIAVPQTKQRSPSFSKVIVSFACRTFTTTNHFRRSSTGASQEHFALFDNPPHTQPSKTVTGKWWGHWWVHTSIAKHTKVVEHACESIRCGCISERTYVETEWKIMQGRSGPNVNEMHMNLI